jgi:enoyl-CoA hydratase/carnithine racemase
MTTVSLRLTIAPLLLFNAHKVIPGKAPVEDDSVRVVIVAGAGQHFSAGHDIGSPQEREDPQRRPGQRGLPDEYKRAWEVGVRKATEYLFTGDWMTAEEALRPGLINRVAPRDKLEEETMVLAQRIALRDPFALRLVKFSLNQIQDEMGFRTAIHSAFYALTVTYRRERGQDMLGGKGWVERRDAAFGAHR